MKKIKSRITLLLALVLVALFIIPLLSMLNVKANEKNVVNLVLSENGEISPPVFDIIDGAMYPGAVINKDFVLRNTTNKKYKIENIGLKDFNIKDISGKVLDVNNEGDLKLIEEYYKSNECIVSCEGIFNNKILYADDIKELIKGKTLEKDITISKDNEKKFNVVVSMKTSSGNNMQGLQANFNIVFNAVSISDETTVEIPTPTEPAVIPPTEAPVVPPIDPPVETPIIVTGEPGEPTEPTKPEEPVE